MSKVPTVFVSYAHEPGNPAHGDRVLALADRLRNDGVPTQLDQYVGVPPKGWQLWMEDEIEAADVVLVVATETYERRRRGREVPGKGLGVRWEGAIISQELYDNALHNTKFFAVIFEPSDSAHVPFFLKTFGWFEVASEEGYVRLHRHLTGQPEVTAPPVGDLVPRPSKNQPAATPTSQLISLNLPQTGEHFFGREADLAQLDAAWENPAVHVLSVVAWGGVGKTALVKHWLANLEREGWRGAERVFAWTFYSQGTGEDRQASSEGFFGEIYR
ncbi:MAG TPA: TIR and AAA domain-containing protein, partial [Thermoanaerobaculia bacterium]|nr:TIR and AAA domain-containing protein [Thermoanaerobaculia bacterium]